MGAGMVRPARAGTIVSSNEWPASLPEAACDVWHDRAVFHFLTEAAQRQAYVAQALR